MNSLWKLSALAAGGCAAVIGLAAAAQSQLVAPTYTSEQAARGKQVYSDQCASCHGEHLDDGQFAAPLRGPAFEAHWGVGGLDGPFTVMTTQMPPTNPASLPLTTYADLMAYVLSENGVAPSATELPSDIQVLKGMAAPTGK